MLGRALRQNLVMKKAFFFFVLAGLCWIVAILLTVRFVQSIKEEASSNLAVVQAPGSAFFAIEEAGPVSLWHNYEDFQGGKTLSNDPRLPGGYGFELKALGSATGVPFQVATMDTQYNNSTVSKKGLGTFVVPAPGDYELTVTSPPGQDRIISLSKGTMMEGIGKIMGLAGVAALLGLFGVVALVLGIVFVIAKPKSPPSIPSHAS